jgi:hypothetical protein
MAGGNHATTLTSTDTARQAIAERLSQKIFLKIDALTGLKFPLPRSSVYSSFITPSSPERVSL